ARRRRCRPLLRQPPRRPARTRRLAQQRRRQRPLHPGRRSPRRHRHPLLLTKTTLERRPARHPEAACPAQQKDLRLLFWFFPEIFGRVPPCRAAWLNDSPSAAAASPGSPPSSPDTPAAPPQIAAPSSPRKT